MAEFYAELDLFKKNKADSSSDVDTVMGEKNTFNKLIVIKDVSGLADRSNEFKNFSTVARKFRFTYV